MRIFVTGASGFIGSAVVQELIGAGHQVIGLARSDKSAQSLVAAGAGVHRGSLEDLNSLRSGAATSDGVIHLAYGHDFSQYVAAGQADKLAIEALGRALAGSDRPLVVTAGLAGLNKSGPVGSEADPLAPSPRMSEPTALALAAQGIRVSVVRLSPSVHGDGDYGFVPMLIGLAREKGVSAYLGEGLNRWPAVHQLDVARLFRLVLENGTAGAIYHGAADEGIPVREIAELIGRRLNLPVVSKSGQEAVDHFGWMNLFAGMDAAASSTVTQQQLDWHPTQPGLLADLEHGRYFN